MAKRLLSTLASMPNDVDWEGLCPFFCTIASSRGDLDFIARLLRRVAPISAQPYLSGKKL